MNAIEVDGITKVIGERKILDDISFEVKQSCIHGFLGPNGAGKTTTMRILCGLAQADAGTIRFSGADINSYHKNLYQKIGFLIEEPPLYEDMRVKDYLQYVAQLRRVTEKELKPNLDYCIDVLDLGEVADRSIENLSRGYKQRVGIAQAIIHMPDIVFLDEPNLGLDPKSITEIRHLIQNLRENHTVILSSHLLHEMSLVCDDITIISRGRIVESAPMASLQKSLESSHSFTIDCTSSSAEFESFLDQDQHISKFSSIKKENIMTYHITQKTNDEIRPQIVKKAVELGADILSVQKENFDLEDYFLKVTEDHD